MRQQSPRFLEPRTILVCQQRQIGDVLLCTPLLELLKLRWPEAHITLFTEKKCVPLLENNPYVDEFLALDKNQVKGLPAQIAWYRKAAEAGFDLLIDCQQLPRCRMLTFFCMLKGTPIRLSFPSAWSKLHLYNLSCRTVDNPSASYAAGTKAALLHPLGISYTNERPQIYLTAEERRQGRELLNGLGITEDLHLVTVDPTHRRASKRWPAERWAAVMDMLAEDESLRFLLLRGPGEDEEVEALREMCKCADRVFIPQPAPSLRMSAACMSYARLHLGGCSAPRHMAVALGVPSIVIPGASGPEWRYPSPEHVEFRPELPCSPCSRVDCPNPLCLTQVKAEEVAAKAREMLA